MVEHICAQVLGCTIHHHEDVNARPVVQNNSAQGGEDSTEVVRCHPSIGALDIGQWRSHCTRAFFLCNSKNAVFRQEELWEHSLQHRVIADAGHKGSM